MTGWRQVAQSPFYLDFFLCLQAVGETILFSFCWSHTNGVEEKKWGGAEHFQNHLSMVHYCIVFSSPSRSSISFSGSPQWMGGLLGGSHSLKAAHPCFMSLLLLSCVGGSWDERRPPRQAVDDSVAGGHQELSGCQQWEGSQSGKASVMASVIQTCSACIQR